MSTPFSRRSFIQSTTVASAGVCLGSHVANAASADKKIAGMVEKAVVDWPVWDSTEEAALLDVLNSGTWGRTTGGRRMLPFETAFAGRMKARFCRFTALMPRRWRRCNVWIRRTRQVRRPRRYTNPPPKCDVLACSAGR